MPAMPAYYNDNDPYAAQWLSRKSRRSSSRRTST